MAHFEADRPQRRQSEVTPVVPQSADLSPADQVAADISEVTQAIDAVLTQPSYVGCPCWGTQQCPLFN